MHSPFAPGERVGARARRWHVALAREASACVALTLDPLDDTSRAARTLLHPFDRFIRIRRHARVRTARLAHALRLIAGAIARPADSWAIPRAVTGAPIDLLPHQFIAALAFVRGVTARLCVMDAVGTGKTIQAGIAIAELLARGLAARVLVIVPAHLRHQWARELARLGVAARVVDAHGRADAAESLPADVSPWAPAGTTIASLDLVKRRDTLVGLDGIAWDLVVVDEAHGAASHTDRHDAVDALARRADRVLLLTATPHDGDDVRYERLVSLGGPDPLLVVRRTSTRPARRIHRLAIAPSIDERAAFSMLDRYRAASERLRDASRAGVTRLIAEVFARRAAASMLALARTAARRRDALLMPEASQPLLFASSPSALDLAGDDDDAIDAVMRAPGALDVRHERAMLGAIHTAALRAARHDTLVDAIARIQRRAREPAIVFAEHRDALVPLALRLARQARVEVLHGGCSPRERARALAGFTQGGSDVLLATDTAAEGLNLHDRCRFVIHLDTPWTPTRMAQREGRVDRHGQRRCVHAWRLERLGREQLPLHTRHAARAQAITDALARHGDTPTLVTASGDTPMPSLRHEAEHACRVIEAWRRADPPAAPAAPRRPLASVRPRTRVVAVRRAPLPQALQAADAIALLSIVVSASPGIALTLERAVALGGPRMFDVAGSLHAQWRRRLATLYPLLEAFAHASARDTVTMLVADAARQRATHDARARLVAEARRTPLASHFVQRGLFAAPDAPPGAAAASGHVASSPAVRDLPRVVTDVVLVIVPVDAPSRDGMRTDSAPAR